MYDTIELKQSDKECKIYLQMAAFNKSVVFKESEFIKESIKSKHAFQMRKLNYSNKEIETASDKGLIMVKLNLKKPMPITFANKTAQRMTGFTEDELSVLTIN